MKIQERKHRLPKESYIGRVRCVFTICTQDRERIFVSEEVFQFMKDALSEALAKTKCEAHVFLFMPDHCHMLIEGTTEESDLWQCMVNFKQRSGYWLGKEDSTWK
jgi:putative transposase